MFPGNQLCGLDVVGWMTSDLPQCFARSQLRATEPFNLLDTGNIESNVFQPESVLRLRRKAQFGITCHRYTVFIYIHTKKIMPMEDPERLDSLRRCAEFKLGKCHGTSIFY